MNGEENMSKKILATAVMALALVGCSGNQNSRPMNDFTFQGSYEKGSYEHFKQTAGDRVFFALASASLSKEARVALDQQVAWLNEYPNTMFTVEGHADERGTSEYNLALGDRRAHAVRRYILGKGIAQSRISTVSFGKERPDVMGHNEAAWSMNRRSVTIVH